MKGSNKVLAFWNIDRCLTADSGIDLREERCRDLQNIYTSIVNRGCKSCSVTNYSST